MVRRTMQPMLFHDGVSIPFSTLLVRCAEGAAATAIVDECFGPAADRPADGAINAQLADR